MNKSPKDIIFDLYRYQILPIKLTQLELFNQEINIDELKSKKNDLFYQTITDISQFKKHNGAPTKHRIVAENGSQLKIILSNEKELVVVNSDFEESQVPNFPYVVLYVNNSPNTQIVAVSRNNKAFKDSSRVIRIIEDTMNKRLKDYNLEVVFNPILDETNFWKLIKKYQRKIVYLEFQIIRPNISNISQKLSEKIKSVANSTNSLKTNLSLNAPKGSVLEGIDESNPDIKDIADYAIEGGSTVKLRVKGRRDVIDTKSTSKSVIGTEYHLEAKGQEALDIFDKLIN